MANALDAFRAQKEAADQVHARLTEVAALLNRLRLEVNGLVTTELRDALREKQSLLTRAETIAVARHFREQEMVRFWPSIWRRWAMPLRLRSQPLPPLVPPTVGRQRAVFCGDS
jgi:hypothetical protein